MKTRSIALVLATASGAALPCQQAASPFRFVPADASAVMRFAAPAKWQQAFAKTNVAKLVNSPTLAPMVQQMVTAVDEGIAEMRQSGGFDADLVEKLLRDYKGELVVATSVDLDGVMAAMAEGRPPHFGVVLALTPDGTFDLPKLAAAIDKAAEDDAPAEGFRDLQVGEVRLRCVDNGDEPDVTVPAMVEGHLVMLISDDAAKFAARVMDTKDRFTGGAGAGSGTMHLHLQLEPIIKAISAALDEQGAPFEVEPVLEATGLMAMQAASLTVGADGKHATIGGELRLAGASRGIWNVFPAARGPEKLLRLVPPGSDTFSVTAIDLGALYTTIGDVWQKLGDDVPMTWEQAQTSFAESMKVRLKEDLFDHLGTEMLSLQEPPEDGGDPDDPLNGLAGMAVGLTLKNGKAFGEAIEKMLRAHGLHAARKTEEYQTTQVHRLRLAGMLEIEYAITDDLLLLSLGNGEGARRALRGVLDARANPPATVELPAPVKERLTLLPQAWSGLSVTSMAEMCTAIGAAAEQGMREAVDDVPEELAAIVGMLKQLGGDLERLGLKTMVSTNRVGPDGIEFHARW